MQTTYTLKSNICVYTTTQAGGDDCTDDVFINHEGGRRNLPSVYHLPRADLEMAFTICMWTSSEPDKPDQQASKQSILPGLSS
jgi:hypothetical protein